MRLGHYDHRRGRRTDLVRIDGDGVREDYTGWTLKVSNSLNIRERLMLSFQILMLINSKLII
jgi:hypothetical protein